MTLALERFATATSPISPRRTRALTYLPATALTVDLVGIALACLLAVFGRHWGLLFDRLPRQADPFQSLTVALNWVVPLLIIGWLLAIAAAGGYKTSLLGAGTDEYKRILHSSLITAGVLGIGCYLVKFPLSRGFFILAFAIGIPILLLGRFLLRRALYQARMRGALQLKVLIAGSPSHVDEIAAVLRRESWLGYDVIGALMPKGAATQLTASGIPVLGTADQVTSVVDASGADVIFIAGGAHDSPTQLRRMAWDLEQHSVQVVVAPSVTDVSRERIAVRPVAGLPLVHLEGPRWMHATRWAKRSFDLLGTLGLIVAFSPLLAFLAARIKLHDRGPVLFEQTRVGRDGKEFSCLKFRTMVPNAEQLLAQLETEAQSSMRVPEPRRSVSVLFKMKDDPRITRPGRWMRRFSLDELPQLFNVLRGDMSLVGPRPPLPHEVEKYEEDMHRRLRVRPGMTGLWQVSGRSDLSWEETVRLDLYYVDNWSMLQDMTILFRTFSAVVSSRGAY
ncbi:sugar transferase [Nocardioides sp.]|uniref:sugar transferase n=1 Tax=Nocardioides sp. TaxID=35761 RepID=UPI002735E246|nr:sugar transferase [Nocardioides sp.]MDP3890634.1 sugar transferase [Nocardioides sp.]